MESHKFKSIVYVALTAAIFNIYAAPLAEQTELTHEQEVAQIAAPLFAKIGMHRSWLEDSLLKTSDNSLRPLADVQDIVERFFKLYPTLLTQAESGGDSLKTKKAKRETIAYTVARTVSGLANVPASERDELSAQALSIITHHSSTTKIASAIDELASVKKSVNRSQLVDALRGSELSDEQRLNFIGAISEINGDVNYAAVIKFLPIAYELTGFDGREDYIYRVVRGLALNATNEKLPALVDMAKQFVSQNKKDSDIDFNNSHLLSAFETLGSIPVELREDFVSIAKHTTETLGANGLYDHLSVLRNLAEYNTIENAQAFLDRIKPTMEKNPKLILEVFSRFYGNYNPNNKEHLIGLINRLGALPNAEANSEENTLPTFAMFEPMDTLCYRSVEESEHLVNAVENVSKENTLNKRQRDSLLSMLGRIAYSKVDIEIAIQALKSFSWAGNSNPSFKEQLNFVSSFFSGFAHLPFSDRSSKIFEEMLYNATRYLTPELVQKHSNLFNNFSLWEFDYEDAPATLMDAIFRSSVYDDLDGTLKCAIAQLRRLNDANREITDAGKASLIFAIAAINPADREAKINVANQSAMQYFIDEPTTKELEREYYFPHFLHHLTTPQQ